MESFATAYPVIFHDGEQDHDKGHVGVHSVLSFKKFQAQMSRLVGIPANQLSAVFVCRRTLKDTDKRQKLPINETTNFNIILNQHNPSRERDCHFLVSLKKPKKERKGTRRRNTEAENGEDEDSTSSRGDISPLEERPKQDFHKFSEAASPTSILQRPLSPLVSPSDDASGQESSDTNRKVLAGTSEKVERILLRRDAVPQEKFPQRVEGFNVPVVTPPAPLQQHRRWNSENRQGAISKEVNSSVIQPPHHVAPLQGEVFHPQRFDDAVDVGRRPGIIPSRQDVGIPQDVSTSRFGGNLGSRGIIQQSGGHPVSPQVSVVNQEAMLIKQPADSQSPCLFCRENNTRPLPFHCCINDRILVGFRRPSPAGPIGRPVKRNVEATA